MDDLNSSAKGANGNAYMNGKANGHAIKTKRQKTPPPSRNFVASTISIVARLSVWFTIATVLFRCPASPELCDETSPWVCKPYFQAKEIALPHIQPYYNSYAAPYVDLARPYYNAVDRTVITPTRGYVTKYGAPRLAQAQAYGMFQWEKIVEPQLAKYQNIAKTQYDQTMGPHVDKASALLAPYYDIARTNALQTYHEILLPSAAFVTPYASQGYALASAFTTDMALPSAYWAWNKTNLFLDSTVWPQLRLLYVDTIEPQLVRIGKRLGRYKEKPETIPMTVLAESTTASSFTKPSQSVAATPEAMSSPSAYTSISATTDSEAIPVTPEATLENQPVESSGTEAVATAAAAENDALRDAREVVAEDLASWQNKFAQAADEGAAEIEHRIDEIAKRMIRRNARTMGKSLIAELDASVKRETAALKSTIIKIVGNSKSSPENKAEDVVQAVRKAGLVIKEKAQDVRTWRENYEMELQALITKASESHFNILTSIRDLALQKIGMKWAWMDGITYKDWAKYHQLRDRFDEWTEDLKKLIVSHPGLEEAQDVAAGLEETAMETAQSAAKELARLKQVGIWKVEAEDASDNFDSDAMKAAADAKNAPEPTEATDTAEAATETSEAEEVPVELDLAPTSEPGEELQAPGFEKGEPVSGAIPVVEEASAIIDAEASSATSPADGPVASESVASSISASIASAVESADANASTAIILEPPQYVENFTEDEPKQEGEETYQDIIRSSAHEPKKASPQTGSVKPALFGAAAQSVPSRKPILDEDVDVTATLSSVSAAAESAYSAAVSRASNQYSAAMSVVSAQIYGTPRPVHEQMMASVAAAYSAATATASARLSEAYEAASRGVYGTPTTQALMPTFIDWVAVQSAAAERLREGREWAEEQYELAKIAIGLAEPKKTSTEKLMEQAKLNYYAGLGMAQARYEEFMSGAAAALSSLTARPTPTDLSGTVSSVVSGASASAASVAGVVTDGAGAAASAASASAAAALSAASEGASAAASIVGDKIAEGAAAASAVGDKIAEGTVTAGQALSESWNAALSRVSAQVYGVPTPTPWYESLYASASGYAGSVSDAAGEYAGAARDSAGEYANAVSDKAGEYAAAASAQAAQASARAAEQYATVSVLVTELLYGKEPTFSESVLSRLSAAYATGAASAASAYSVASESASSVASGATEAVKETVGRVRDEL